VSPSSIGSSKSRLRALASRKLSATLKATQIPDHVAVGQIHLGTGTPSSTKPLLELFYYATGSIVLAIEQSPAGGNEVMHPVGNVPVGTKWSYVIGLSGNTISLAINGGAAQTFAMSSTFNQENMYFKAGDYDQSFGTDPTVGAKIHFYALTIFHGIRHKLSARCRLARQVRLADVAARHLLAPRRPHRPPRLPRSIDSVALQNTAFPSRRPRRIERCCVALAGSTATISRIDESRSNA
jgi:hypothetical protein